MSSIFTSLFSSKASSSNNKAHLIKNNLMGHEAYAKNNHKESTPKMLFSSNQLTLNDNQTSLHIMLVTETWFPDVNGVSMSLSKIMKYLSEMGHTISIIRPIPRITKISSLSSTPSPLPLNNSSKENIGKLDFISHDIQVKGLPIPKYTDLQLGMPSYHFIKKKLKAIQPDIVHIATEGPLGLSTLIAAKQLKMPATTGYHTQFHDFSKHFGMGIISRPMMAYFKKLHNWSHATCVPSQKTENDLAKLGFKRLYQVGRGVDMVLFNPEKRSDELRASWGVGQQDTVLIMVSRLSPEKGVDLVIKSFIELQAQQIHRALKLVIVGDGPDKSRLESISKNNTDIIFTGMQTHEILAQHYASADAFVFASQLETFGNVVTEAMASGLPVFAFNDAAAGMLVNENCGSLATVGDENEFRSIVVAMPKLQQLKAKGIKAREAVSALSWQRPANQILRMFNDAIQKVSSKKC